jgi:hypothetical protein
MQEEQIINTTPTAGPSFRGRPVRPDGFTEGTVDLPYDEEEILPPDVPVSQQVIGTTAPMVPVVAPATPAPQATATPDTDDPYASLSKTQKRMLAFAGLSDAGRALQGKQGTAVDSLLREFRGRADMARKERQAQLELEAEQAKQAQIDALLMGVTGLSPAVQASADTTTQMSTTERLQQEIAALQNAMPAYLQAGMVDEFKTMLQTKQDQLAKATAAQEEYDIDLEQATGQIRSTEQALRVAERALTAAGKYDSVEEMLSALQAGEYDPSSFFITRQGIMPDMKPFRDFQSFAEQFSSIMTFQNLQAILATGAKLGTLSDADLKAIGAISGPMDAVNNPRQTAQNIQFAYQQLKEELEQQEEKLAELKLKGY